MLTVVLIICLLVVGTGGLVYTLSHYNSRITVFARILALTILGLSIIEVIGAIFEVGRARDNWGLMVMGIVVSSLFFGISYVSRDWEK